MISDFSDTIIALATPNAVGAIGVIRISGPGAIDIVDSVFGSKELKSKKLHLKPANTIHFGVIHKEGLILDEVLVSLFKAPHSYTGEDVVEIGCHGSPYIQQQLINLLIERGARSAKPGEFTLRAFMNRKMDLSQAEAVADLIASESAASHHLAMNQMRGGFSKEIGLLRDQLISFASLIELELDFSTEDVEFADRTQLNNLVRQIYKVTKGLADSFSLGNVIKNGVPVAIVGKPNAGKSTLLNALLNEDRAIVSEIAGTTRDTIEDEITIEGIVFRFIDTAGIRDTTDRIESIGVAKTFEKIRQAAIVVYLFDINKNTQEELDHTLNEIKSHLEPHQHLLVVGNKADEGSALTSPSIDPKISALQHSHLPELKVKLLDLVNFSKLNSGQTIITNARHREALNRINFALEAVLSGLTNQVPGDLLAMDIRQALHYLGEISGEVTTDDLLGTIFSKFCIGK